MKVCWTRRGPVAAGLLAAGLGLAGCGSSADSRFVGDYVTRTDFENLAGWGADVTALSGEHARSGSRATFIGPDREYSLTYMLPLKRVSVHPVRGLDVSAWVYVPSGTAAAVLTVQVFRPPGQPGPPLFSGTLPVLEQIHEYNVWQPLHQVFELPPDLPGDAELRIFLYRGDSRQAVYLDDLEVKARE